MDTTTNQTLFIGRKIYLDEFDQFMDSDHLRVLFFHGPGGVGKTWLLAKMFGRLSSEAEAPIRLMIDLFTSDHRSIEGLNYGIVKLLKPLMGEQHFQNYESRVDAFEAAQKAEQYTATMAKEVRQAFIDDCKALSPRKVVVFLDTFEVVQHGAVGDWIINVLGRELSNFRFVIAGRHEWPVQDHVESKRVDGFTYEEALEYYCLREKIDSTYPASGTEDADQLKHLIAVLWEKSSHNPLLICLALEWFGASILQPEILQGFSKEQFEAQVIAPIQDIGQGTFGAPEMDMAVYHTLLMMAFFNQRFSVEFFDHLIEQKKWVNLEGISTSEVLKHLEQNFHFVKTRPDGNIQLHDEMQRLVMQYLWPGFDRMGDYSKELAEQALKWYDQMIAEAQSDSKNRNDWVAQELQAERLLYLLRSDLEDGWKVFIQLFDTSAKEHHLNVCDIALTQVSAFQEKLASDHCLDLDLRKAQLDYEYQMYDEADRYVLALSNQPISPAQACKLYILWGNIKMRLGKFQEAVEHLKDALKISQENQFVGFQIRSLNVLGYAYRLIGKRNTALDYYRRARNLCLDHNRLDLNYYWILNNLSFLSSYIDRGTAIGNQKQVIKGMEALGDKVGLAAALSTLGCLYYQDGRPEKAEEYLNQALDLFEKIGHREWMGRVLSWRGAMNQDKKDLKQAEADLKHSLEIGFADDRAMTLCRLGRVYMSQRRWDDAEIQMQASYECAKQLPDYIYWLGALGRLVILAAEKRAPERLAEYEAKLAECCNVVEEEDKNSLGIAYLGLGRLAINQYALTRNEPYLTSGIQYLQDGLINVVEYGSYAHTDVSNRLAFIEADFVADRVGAEIVWQVGQQLEPVFRKKEEEHAGYSVVVPILHRWSHWDERR